MKHPFISRSKDWRNY